MPPVSASVSQNHNSIGDLVPMDQKLLSQPGVQKFVEVLMQQLLQQDEAATDKKWEVINVDSFKSLTKKNPEDFLDDMEA